MKEPQVGDLIGGRYLLLERLPKEVEVKRRESVPITGMWKRFRFFAWFCVKWWLARYQVRRFCERAARPAAVDDFAAELACHRTVRDLLFREPGVLRIYFNGRSEDTPMTTGCGCCNGDS